MMIELSDGRPSQPDLSPAAAEFLRLMADPTRRQIFLQLMSGEICNCEMVKLLDLPQNLISHHLRQLRKAGLVRARRDLQDQRWIYYAVDRQAFEAVSREIGAFFDPARLGDRVPRCGPATEECCR